MVYGRELPVRSLASVRFSRNLSARRLSDYIVAMLQDELSEFEHHNVSLAESPDPELVKFPAPRHPWRRVTIFTLLLCFGVSLALLLELRSELGYALRPGPPQSVGALAALSPGHP